ncbi:MAG TPA: hypothetical protein VN675_04345, partial [Burkholderiales bacterium]|nr:hypothetical protein [Burkholderiales bacterium]
MGETRRRLLGSMGLVLVAPRLAQGQGKRVHKLGIMALGRFGPLDDAFLAALAKRGWSAGKNLQVDARVTA